MDARWRIGGLQTVVGREAQRADMPARRGCAAVAGRGRTRRACGHGSHDADIECRWAQIALTILIIVGPVFIPFLVFDPLSFLFWGWFRAMITYSLYAVIAGAVLRVFSAVGIAYITSMGSANMNFTSLMDVGLWTLAIVPFFTAGLLASLKIGELASMLVTGGGAGGSGLMGMVSTAGMAVASGGTAAAAKAGAGAAAVK